MVTAESLAQGVIALTCGSEFDGFAVVYSFSPLVERIPNRKRRRQRIEQQRLVEVVATIERQLLETLADETATRLAKTEGFADCLRITKGGDELLAAVADRFRSGDNVYDSHDVKNGVFRIAFWYDDSHRRWFK